MEGEEEEDKGRRELEMTEEEKAATPLVLPLPITVSGPAGAARGEEAREEGKEQDGRTKKGTSPTHLTSFPAAHVPSKGSNIRLVRKFR